MAPRGSPPPLAREGSLAPRGRLVRAMGQRPVRELLRSRPLGIALLAALYLAAARFGLAFGVVEQVTAIWPPSGLALAALFLGGRALWPGLWLGALAANLL